MINAAVAMAPVTDTISRFLEETISNAIHIAWIIPDHRGPGTCGGRWFGNDVDAAVA